jgi:hypothetical protein
MTASNLRTVVISSRTPQTFREVVGGNVYVTSSRSGIVYPRMTTKTVAGRQTLSFTFPFPPAEVSYSDLAPEVSEISRPGKKPLVYFSRYRSRKITLRFIVAVPFDGLQIDVEESLDLIKQIANSNIPVFFSNADKFLSSSFTESRSAVTAYWNIADLSFDSVRRTESQKISQASVSMTLIENDNPTNIQVRSLPRIEYTAVPPVSNPSVAGKPQNNVNAKWSDNEKRTITRGAFQAATRASGGGSPSVFL